jgi:DNA mismatch endonuclease (patch repair protein)
MAKPKSGKDRLTKAARSALMGKIKSKNTGFERQVFSELRKKGLHFRKHYSRVIGNPDIALPKERKAVFLHSDFWHGWRMPLWEDVLPNNFWKEKLRRNRLRDRKVIRSLRRKRWKVMVVWEHQIEKAPTNTIERIATFLRKKV